MKGDSNKHVARFFKIAEATVKAHVKGIFRKIGASNRTQAAMWAVQNWVFEAWWRNWKSQLKTECLARRRSQAGLIAAQIRLWRGGGTEVAAPLFHSAPCSYPRVPPRERDQSGRPA